MRHELTIALILSILSCSDHIKTKSLNNCFFISQYPEFKFGTPIDTSRIPYQMMPFDTREEEMAELLNNSNAYMCFGFDGGISTLIFSLEKSDQKLNGISAMWTILSDPKAFLLSVKGTYLPCMPIKAILDNPNTPVESRINGISEYYQYSNNYSPGIKALHYWVGLRY